MAHRWRCCRRRRFCCRRHHCDRCRLSRPRYLPALAGVPARPCDGHRPLWHPWRLFPWQPFLWPPWRLCLSRPSLWLPFPWRLFLFPLFPWQPSRPFPASRAPAFPCGPFLLFPPFACPACPGAPFQPSPFGLVLRSFPCALFALLLSLLPGLLLCLFLLQLLLFFLFGKSDLSLVIIVMGLSLGGGGWHRCHHGLWRRRWWRLRSRLWCGVGRWKRCHGCGRRSRAAPDLGFDHGFIGFFWGAHCPQQGSNQQPVRGQGERPGTRPAFGAGRCKLIAILLVRHGVWWSVRAEPSALQKGCVRQSVLKMRSMTGR